MSIVALVAEYKLKPTEAWLYSVILELGEIEIGLARLCKLANMSRSAVMRLTTQLENKGLVEVRRDDKDKTKQREVNQYKPLVMPGSFILKLPSVNLTPDTSTSTTYNKGVETSLNLTLPSSILTLPQQSTPADIQSLYDAYQHATGLVAPDNQRNRTAAKKLIELDFTPSQIEDCARAQLKNRPKSKTYLFHYLADGDAVNWRTTQTKKLATAEDILRHHGIEPAPEDVWKWEVDMKPGSWARHKQNGSGEVSA